jgi:dienelactone hydrolase
MALIAPRGLMLTTALSEEDSNIWGIEEAYHSAAKVYKFLGAENNLAIRSRYGLHGLSAGEIENYVDFFDYIFKRSDRKPENRLYCNYSFDTWQGQSKENINPENYPVKGIDDIESDARGNKIGSVAAWGEKKPDIVKSIKWALGDEPSGVRAPGPGKFRRGGQGEDSFGSYLERPKPTKTMGVMAISPYSGFGDHLYGYLYYPADEEGNLKNQKLPVVIYLHEYDYSKGFDSHHQVESLFQSLVETGYAVFAFDMLGFGNRIEEGTHFYDRYPNWSKLGKMVADVQGAVDALTNLDFIDGTKIYVEGYSLGGMVGLYTAALDERIAGVISVAAFTPMRLNTADRGTEGIKAYSHMHGLLPRLGFFTGKESHIPYDFHEILSCIAPRPVLVIAPVMDKDAHYDDIKQCVEQTGKIYDLYGAGGNLQLFSPDDYNRFSPEMRVKANEWLLSEKLKSTLLGGN